MTSFEDTVWRHLVTEHNAHQMDFPASKTTRRVRPLTVTASATGVAAVAAAVVLILSATTNTPPAYALTSHANGTYTLTLNNLSTGIPAINAKLTQLGIPDTVVPVQAGCTATMGGPTTSTPVPKNSTIPTGTLPTESGSQTITLTANPLPAGSHGFIAAQQQPGGQVILAEGTTSEPIPSCFPSLAG
jgi:hypothetical protein